MQTYDKILKEIEDYIFVEDLPEEADIIFVPGNGYPQMAESAAQLYKRGFAPYVLPSGRYSITTGAFSGVLKKEECYPGPYETEWQFLKDVLCKSGVPAEAVLKEDQATFTYENARFSRIVTEQKGLKIQKAILCCKAYHARRSLLYYQYVFPETRFFVVPSAPDGIRKENWKDTKEGVDAVMGELNRIVKQFSFMMK